MSTDMELINKIEAQISELENRFKKNSDFISSANVSMEKLSADKISATNDSNIINGALQAFRGVLVELKGPVNPANDTPVVINE